MTQNLKIFPAQPSFYSRKSQAWGKNAAEHAPFFKECFPQASLAICTAKRIGQNNVTWPPFSAKEVNK